MSKFYVSVKEGECYGLLAGPYDTHDEALEMVPEVKRVAQGVDPWAVFYAFGTAKTSPGHCKPGTLNHLLGRGK